jgi:hypothetical protein
VSKRRTATILPFSASPSEILWHPVNVVEIQPCLRGWEGVGFPSRGHLGIDSLGRFGTIVIIKGTLLLGILT